MTFAAELTDSGFDRRVALPTVAIAGLGAWLSWEGWHALQDVGVWHSLNAGQIELAGPAVLGFVLAVFCIEQVDPAERRRVSARGHLLDLGYLVAHAMFVVPVIVLIGTGFAGRLAQLAPWLVLPRCAAIPHWCYVLGAVVAIDAVDWLVHLGNHKVRSLWRLHAVHHSQEELSILSTFRTHPLVHVSFVISAVPVLALAANTATPAAILTAYACLGAMPHANVRWTYGRFGRYIVSPAYHRRHHSPTERLDVNLGTVLTIWDRLSGRAVPAVPTSRAAPTGLAGRPVPVEQAGERAALLRTFVSQWTQPFLTPPPPPQGAPR